MNVLANNVADCEAQVECAASVVNFFRKNYFGILAMILWGMRQTPVIEIDCYYLFKALKSICLLLKMWFQLQNIKSRRGFWYHTGEEIGPTNPTHKFSQRATTLFAD